MDFMQNTAILFVWEYKRWVQYVELNKMSEGQMNGICVWVEKSKVG